MKKVTMQLGEGMKEKKHEQKISFLTITSWKKFAEELKKKKKLPFGNFLS